MGRGEPTAVSEPIGLPLHKVVFFVRREEEHGMVRHEAAEALGAIGSKAAVEVLREHCEHAEEILRESCWVALMWLE